MKKVTIAAATLFVSMGLAGAAAAQSSGGLAGQFNNGGTSVQGAGALNGPAVGGNVTSTVNAGNLSAEAEEDSIASNRLGSVTGGAVGGNVDLRANVGNVRAKAEEGSCAENVVASVGQAACDNFN